MPRKEYDTHQREDLLGFFKRHPDRCFSVGDLLADSDLAMGQATVYRLLSRFEEEGELVRFVSPGGRGALYQYKQDACRSHFHLKCLSCGTLIHMDCAFMKEMERHIRAEHDFAVDNAKTTIYGFCAACRGKEEAR